MKRFYKKALIYLLAVAMVAPAWLANGMLSATKVKAAETPKILINEFMPNPDPGNDWIELFNPNSTDIDLEGWRLADSTSSMKTFVSPEKIVANGYLKVDVANRLGQETDVIQLFDSSSAITPSDIISYANGISVGSNKSIGRISDGASEWIVFGNSSPDEANYVANITPTSGSIMVEKEDIIPLNITVTPNANYDGVFGISLELNNKLLKFSDLFEYIKVDDSELDLSSFIVGYPNNSTGIDLVFGVSQTFAIEAKIINTDTVDNYDFGVGLIDAEWNDLSNMAQYSLALADTTAPVITLNGDSEVTIKKDDVYTDAGATALDNYDGDISSAITPNGTVDTNTIGDYTITYDVMDAAGNSAIQVIRTIHVVEQIVLGTPIFTVTPVTENGKNYAKIEWDGVGGGVDGYNIYIGGVWNFETKKSDSDAGMKYSRMIEISKYGTFNVLVVAKKGTLTSANTTYKTVTFSAPAVVSEVIPAPAVETPVVSVAPTTVKAAPPAEQKIETPSDDNGQIKGEEETTSEKEDINWTPWIVLFVLILLAGAATGGYFYWFAGSEEEDNKPITKEEKKIEKKAIKKSAPKAPNRKSKRW